KHFRGEKRHHIIGLYPAHRPTAGAADVARFGVIDIDRHGDEGDAAANLAAALAWREAAAHFRPLLLDSNGAGAFHVWIPFCGSFEPADPIALREAYAFLKWIVRDWRDYGFTRAPETFPKTPVLAGKLYGNWVRLPGRHHKRDHASAV